VTAPGAGAGPKTSRLAIASLALSLGSLLLGPLGYLPGIICGHLAKGRIRRDPALGGRGLANAGLGIGYGILALNVIIAALFFSVIFSAVKEAMSQAETQAGGKPPEISQAQPADPNNTGSTRPKAKAQAAEGGAATDPAAKASQKTSSDPGSPVRKVVRAFIEAEKNRDVEAAKKSLTAAAQQNFKSLNLGAAVAVGVGEEKAPKIVKTEVDGDAAKCNVKVEAKPMDLTTQFRLKREEGEWKIYAITLLMENDEPAFTVDLEKGMTPALEGDPQKVAAFIAKLSPELGKTINAGKKAGSKGAARPAVTPAAPTPPPAPVAAEPEPPKPKPEPEPVVALDFGNRRRPLSFEFVEFTSTGAAGGFKANVVNYANKSIRKVDVQVFFLDAGASPLGEASLSLLEGGEPLVLKNGQAQLEFKNVKILPDARKAVIELRETQFTDGTKWRMP
jgi:hypothetical protein